MQQTHLDGLEGGDRQRQTGSERDGRCSRLTRAGGKMDETDRQTERQTNRQAGRQADRQRQTGSERDGRCSRLTGRCRGQQTVRIFVLVLEKIALLLEETSFTGTQAVVL